MESDRNRAASNNLDRKQGCPRASSASYPLDEKLKDVFMDVTLCRLGICIYLMKRNQKDTKKPDVDTFHS